MINIEKIVVIIGAGNIGSRHLQALKAVDNPLKIFVIDPSSDSLLVAKKKYDSILLNNNRHIVKYTDSIEQIGEEIDIAIIATNSDVRRMAIERLLKLNKVKYLILEKLLFQKVEDYYAISTLLKTQECQAWVNCNRRIMPLYRDKIKKLFNQKKIFYYCISGSISGLISNVIHDIDYMAYLLELNEFSVDTSYLDKKLIPSKRKNFLELTGILQIHFKDGSHGFFVRYPSGTLPEMITIDSNTDRCIINLVDEISWVKNVQNSNWETFNAQLLYTSKITTSIVESILNNDRCDLPSYEDSTEIHLNLLEPLLKFINKNSNQKYNFFPFT